MILREYTFDNISKDRRTFVDEYAYARAREGPPWGKRTNNQPNKRTATMWDTHAWHTDPRGLSFSARIAWRSSTSLEKASEESPARKWSLDALVGWRKTYCNDLRVGSGTSTYFQRHACSSVRFLSRVSLCFPFFFLYLTNHGKILFFSFKILVFWRTGSEVMFRALLHSIRDRKREKTT